MPARRPILARQAAREADGTLRAFLVGFASTRPTTTRRSTSFRRSKFRISPGSVLALIALFVALGGVSYAAVTINGKNIKNNSVRARS